MQTAALGNHNAILRKESEMIKDQLRRYFEGKPCGFFPIAYLQMYDVLAATFRFLQGLH